MSFFEQYTMAIPIFAPNVDFTTRHHLQYNFLSDKMVILIKTLNYHIIQRTTGERVLDQSIHKSPINQTGTRMSTWTRETIRTLVLCATGSQCQITTRFHMWCNSSPSSSWWQFCRHSGSNPRVCTQSARQCVRQIASD